MTNELSVAVWLWLVTYTLHSSLLLGGVWLFERLRRDASPALRETLWRAALFGALATATLQSSGLVESRSGALPVAVGGAALRLDDDGSAAA
jgi:hypothetical protein